MSTNEEAVNKPASRRKPAKAPAKKKSASSAKGQKPKRKINPFAETGIVITGGLLDGAMGIKIMNNKFGSRVIDGYRYIPFTSLRARTKLITITTKNGPIGEPIEIPDDEQESCKIDITILY